jgi:hypothetical protein
VGIININKQAVVKPLLVLKMNILQAENIIDDLPIIVQADPISFLPDGRDPFDINTNVVKSLKKIVSLTKFFYSWI